MTNREKELIQSLQQIILSVIMREKLFKDYSMAKAKKKNELADMIATIDENSPDDEKRFISLLKKIR